MPELLWAWGWYAGTFVGPQGGMPKTFGGSGGGMPELLGAGGGMPELLWA